MACPACAGVAYLGDESVGRLPRNTEDQEVVAGWPGAQEPPHS